MVEFRTAPAPGLSSRPQAPLEQSEGVAAAGPGRHHRGANRQIGPVPPDSGACMVQAVAVGERSWSGQDHRDLGGPYRNGASSGQVPESFAKSHGIG